MGYDRSQPPPPCSKCGGQRAWITDKRKPSGVQAHCAACIQANRLKKAAILNEQHKTGDPSGSMCKKCGLEKVWVCGKKSAQKICLKCRARTRRMRAESLRDSGVKNGDQADTCPKCGDHRTWVVSKSKAHRRCHSCEAKSSKHSTYSSKHSTYRKGAKKRGYTWKISQEQFLLLTSAYCCYCGKSDSAASYGMGIDRWDNSRGYFADNVVPCCKDCNRAKSTRTPRDFVEGCRAIAAQHGAILSPTLETIVNPLGYRMDWDAGTSDDEGGK